MVGQLDQAQINLKQACTILEKLRQFENEFRKEKMENSFIDIFRNIPI